MQDKIYIWKEDPEWYHDVKVARQLYYPEEVIEKLKSEPDC